MTDGVMFGVPMNAGANVVSPTPQGQNRGEVRKVVQQELRFRELADKFEKGELSKNERIEFETLRVVRALDKVSQMPGHICYLA